MQEETGYRKVEQWVMDGLADGTLRQGDRLPSEKELQEKFHLSRQTIRHATGDLAKRGILKRIQGSGTYIGSAKRPEKKRRTMRIAVISTFSESYIFPQILRGIERVLSESGYAMQVAFTDNSPERERKILENILGQNAVDGILVEPCQSALPNPNLALYRKAEEKHLPVLFFHASYPGLDFPCVRMDDKYLGEQAAGLLLAKGHRKIGGIFKADDGQGPLRYEGFRKALWDAGTPLIPSHAVFIDSTAAQNLRPLSDYLFLRLRGCTGIVCYNDEVACQMVDLALDAGIRVPEDLSLVGMDDADIARVCRVPLTTFPHPKEELGAKAAENLLQLIRNPLCDGNYLFRTGPVLRDSVAGISGQ